MGGPNVSGAIYFNDHVMWARGLVMAVMEIVLVGVVFCFMLACARERRRRCTFTLIGIGILLALDEVSKVSWPAFE